MRIKRVFTGSFSWIRESIRQRDEYSKNVQLFYKGKTEFNTFFGGFVSLLIKIIVLAYAIKVVTDVVNRTNTNKFVTKAARNLLHDTTNHYIGKGTFAFAVNFVGPYPERMIDPSYFSLHMNIDNVRRAEGRKDLYSNQTEIEFDFCGDKFPFVEKTLYDRVGLQTFICPKNTDYFVTSNFNSDRFDGVSVILRKCVGDGCQSEEDINWTIDNHWFEVGLINSYFDFDNVENPVQSYYEDTSLYPLKANFPSLLLVRVTQNEYVVDDNLYFLGIGGKKGTFYSINTKDIRQDNADNLQNLNHVFSVWIHFSTEYEIYERNSFTFFDMFGLIGGIYELFSF